MTYHLHVEEVKFHLEEKNDPRLKIMRLLTEPSCSTYRDDYKRMWKSLHKVESEYCGSDNHDWVLLFLDDVIECTAEAPYFYLSGKQRTGLIKRVKKHTDALKTIFEHNGLNTSLISNDGQFFHGFHSYDEKGNKITEASKRPKVSICDVLDFFQSYIENEVSESAQKGKIVGRRKSNRFVRCLAERNLDRYDQILAPVIIMASSAIYGEEYKRYSEADIANLVYGRD